MNAQELRIGNYVFLSDKDGNKRPFQMEAFDIYKVDESNCYDISPITLTPEVLEACGFNRVKYGYGTPFKYYQFNHKSGFFFIDSERDGLYCENSNSEVYVTSVNSLHHLQNVFYCLKYEELNIDIDKLKNAVK